MADQRDEKIERLTTELRAAESRAFKAEASNKRLADDVSRLAQHGQQLERELYTAISERDTLAKRRGKRT